MRFNISRIKELALCPTRAKFLYEDGLVPKDKDTRKVDFGTAIHEALKSYYEPRDRSELESGKSWQPGFNRKRALNSFKKSLPDECKNSENEIDTQEYGVGLLNRYFELMYKEDKKLIKEVKAVEKQFEALMVWGKKEYTLITRPDMVAWFDYGSKFTRGWYHNQYKTLAPQSSPGIYLTAMSMDWHEPGYGFALNSNGIELKGSVITVLRKLLSGPKDRKTGVREIREDWNPFVRERIEVGKSQIDRFSKDMEYYLRQWERYKEEKNWPRNTTQCVNGYGKVCDYIGLCKKMPFIKEEWDKREKDYVDIEHKKPVKIPPNLRNR